MLFYCYIRNILRRHYFGIFKWIKFEITSDWLKSGISIWKKKFRRWNRFWLPGKRNADRTGTWIGRILDREKVERENREGIVSRRLSSSGGLQVDRQQVDPLLRPVEKISLFTSRKWIYSSVWGFLLINNDVEKKKLGGQNFGLCMLD
jgi:hypothetical protein